MGTFLQRLMPRVLEIFESARYAPPYKRKRYQIKAHYKNQRGIGPFRYTSGFT